MHLFASFNVVVLLTLHFSNISAEMLMGVARVGRNDHIFTECVTL